MDLELLPGIRQNPPAPDVPGDDTALARLDALAETALSWVAPVHFCVAQTEAERQAAYHLRYLAVIERGWLQPADMPEGREHDEFDDQAIHVLAWDGDIPVATCRLILPAAGLALPTEIAFDLQVEPAGEVVDAGRFVVARPYSSQEHLLLACLLARTWLEVRSLGYTRCCAAFASRGMLRLLFAHGFPLPGARPTAVLLGMRTFPLAVRCDRFRRLPGAKLGPRRTRALIEFTRPSMTDRQTPPGPSASPLLGNLPAVRRDPLGFLTSCARTYGDVARYRVLGFPVYLFSHPDAIETILVTQPQNFQKGRIAQASRSLFGNGLLLSEGAAWRRQRRLMQPGLTSKRVSRYAPLVVEQTRRKLAGWQDGQVLEIHTEMVALTMQIIAQALFGTRLDQEVSQASAALKVFLQCFRAQVNTGMTLPERLPTPANLRLRRAIRDLDNIVYRMIQQRRLNPGEQDDLLSIVLNARDEDGSPMSDEQLRDEMLTLFIAGHETTATALAWTFYLVASHPQVEVGLLAELGQVLNGRSPTVEDLPRLTYAEKVVKEALRLYPPAWALSRLALQDCEIGGYTVPAGASVVMSQWVVQRDPRFFPRPELFLPERWTNEFELRLPRFAFFPFGGGPRVCIGSSFAMQEAVLVLSAVVQQVHLGLAAGQKVEPWATLVLRPKNGILLEVERRP